MGTVTKGGESLSYVACKVCFKAFRFLGHKTGTTHLKRHIEDCKDKAGNSKKRLQSKLCFPTVKLPEQAKKKVVKAAVQLAANDMRPFSILDGKGMRIFCQSLVDVGATYGKVDVNELLPSRNTVSKKLHQTAGDERRNIVKLLEKAIFDNGGIGMTVDLWIDNYKKIVFCYVQCRLKIIQ